MLRETPQVPQTLAQHLDRHFAKLSSIGAQPDGSISRIAFGDAESAAMAYVRSEAEAFGCVGRYDGIGNLVVSAPVERRRRVLVWAPTSTRSRTAAITTEPPASSPDSNACASWARSRPTASWASTSWSGAERSTRSTPSTRAASAAFGLSETHVLHNRFGRPLAALCHTLPGLRSELHRRGQADLRERLHRLDRRLPRAAHRTGRAARAGGGARSASSRASPAIAASSSPSKAASTIRERRRWDAATAATSTWRWHTSRCASTSSRRASARPIRTSCRPSASSTPTPRSTPSCRTSTATPSRR